MQMTPKHGYKISYTGDLCVCYIYDRENYSNVNDTCVQRFSISAYVSIINRSS